MNLLGREYRLFQGVNIIDAKGLSEPMTNNIIVFDRSPLFGLEIYFIFPVDKLLEVHKTIYTIIQSLEGRLKSFQKFIKIFHDKILMYGIVKHVLASPIYIEPCMLNKVVIQETSELSRVLKFNGRDIVYLK